MWPSAIRTPDDGGCGYCSMTDSTRTDHSALGKKIVLVVLSMGVGDSMKESSRQYSKKHLLIQRRFQGETDRRSD
eukprot:scaffold3273_cov148-Cylindrotheca_fusiformis.AAC.15